MDYVNSQGCMKLQVHKFNVLVNSCVHVDVGPNCEKWYSQLTYSLMCKDH